MVNGDYNVPKHFLKNSTFTFFGTKKINFDFFSTYIQTSHIDKVFPDFCMSFVIVANGWRLNNKAHSGGRNQRYFYKIPVFIVWWRGDLSVIHHSDDDPAEAAGGSGFGDSPQWRWSCRGYRRKLIWWPDSALRPCWILHDEFALWSQSGQRFQLTSYNPGEMMILRLQAVGSTNLPTLGQAPGMRRHKKIRGFFQFQSIPLLSKM